LQNHCLSLSITLSGVGTPTSVGNGNISFDDSS
jgi:hypothetical protein